MIQRIINTTTFKGFLTLRASEKSQANPLRTRIFETDDIRDIKKLPSNDTLIIYKSTNPNSTGDKAVTQTPFFVPKRIATTKSILTAYTAACQNKNIGISI